LIGLTSSADSSLKDISIIWSLIFQIVSKVNKDELKKNNILNKFTVNILGLDSELKHTLIPKLIAFAK